MAQGLNRFLCVLLCLPLGVVSGGSASRHLELTLNGEWRLRSSNGSLSLPAQVPGCVHSALLQQRYIKDPYFRFNDLSYQWIALDNWTYTTTFTVPSQIRVRKKVLLVFDGVDTAASISLNGIVVGKTDNMFRRYDFSVRKLLKDGENVLEVSLLSPVFYSSERRKAHSSYSVPPECPPDVQKGECHVNFIRKEQSSFSWDWGPSFPTMGIWKDVRLDAFDVLHLIQLSSLPLYNYSSTQWRLQVELLVDAVQTTSCQVELSLSELDSKQTIQNLFLQGRLKYNFTLHINKSSKVKRWWPSGHGGQPFYHFTVKGFQDKVLFLSSESKVYFRTVELIQEPVMESPGLSFYFRINEKSLFLKGSNWIPADSFQDRVNSAVLRNLLQSAVDANMNALRVWGGGVYEQDLFYNLCDELGIMVWQDFMFACAMYPTEDDFIQTVREEVIQQVQRLKSHPSIIVWSGNNENEAALATNWFNIPASQKPTYIKDYVKLYVNNIRKIVQEEDQSRPFLVSSPTNGAESEQEGWVAANPYDPHFGDVHFYNYNMDCWDWRTFPRTRFASEYGFQSWPSFSTLEPVSIPEDWSYNSNFTSHRQHHESGNQQMLQQAALHFNLPNSTVPLKRFTDTLYITQVNVYSWSDLDSICTLTSDQLLVSGGSAAAIFKQPVTSLLAGCGGCTRLTCLLSFHLENNHGIQQGPTNHHFLCSPKDAQGLQRPNITAKVQEDKSGFMVILHSDSVAPFVWLDVGHIQGRFSVNGFLIVSRNKTVHFDAWQPTSVAELSRSLSVTTLMDVY
ncbi:beta-mannosidase isoform X2 [Kryptolebias marmoratus]|nr:beta-mannosidase isoform X2 [Kryptolebias marmoratus]